MYAYICVYTSICIYMYVCIYIYIYLYMVVSAKEICMVVPQKRPNKDVSFASAVRNTGVFHIRICIYIYMCIYIYVYTYMYTYVYTW